MFITQQNEIISLMPTARWDRPSQLFGYLEEEERVALEPLLGTDLYEYLCTEYERLIAKYTDITSTTIRPTKKAKTNPQLPYADVTERLDALQVQMAHKPASPTSPTSSSSSSSSDVEEFSTVSDGDMAAIRLIRICQQIEFYKMLSHKAGLLTVSFNEGGGMNTVSADNYEPADAKRMEHLVKDAYMSAGRAIDTLLLYLEADAKGSKRFTERWSKADAFYLHKDLLFQTARVLNEYLDIKGERMAYISLVRDIRFCQGTYLKPRVGMKLLQAVVAFANGEVDNDGSASSYNDVMQELLSLLRTALAFYVEARRTSLEPAKDKLARRDSMADAQQAMASVCDYIEDNLEMLGDVAVGSPIYKCVRAREEELAKYAADEAAATERQRKAARERNNRKLFTAFPVTHRPADYNK